MGYSCAQQDLILWEGKEIREPFLIGRIINPKITYRINPSNKAVLMKNELPILLFECANAHGGDFDKLKSTIELFKEINYPEKHIKFQAFHPDAISLPDCPAYEIYQDLLLSQQQWTEIIELGSGGFQIWLDIFDRYGVDVMATNIEKIFGIKLQASVLENNEVISALQNGDLLDGKVLMLNISGFEIPQIQNFINVFSTMKMKELVLQIGHQAYPTQLKDTGIQKVAILKNAFSGYKICIADHVEGGTDMACIIPLLGMAAGSKMIEKHICLDRSTAKYDHSSALEFSEMQLLADRIKQSFDVISGPFISDSEKEYLTKSIQIPVSAKFLAKGSLIAKSDLLFRRTGQTGDSFSAILQLQQQHYVLNESIAEKTTIKTSQLARAKIGVILFRGNNAHYVLLDKLSTVPVNEEVFAASSNEKNWRSKRGSLWQLYKGISAEYAIDILISIYQTEITGHDHLLSQLITEHFLNGADCSIARSSGKEPVCEIYTTAIFQRIIEGSTMDETGMDNLTDHLQNTNEGFKISHIDF